MPGTRNGFQQFVNRPVPPAVAGDFAGANPRASWVAPSAGYVAPAEGLVVGRFAWGVYASGLAYNRFRSGAQLGFIRRENQAIITASPLGGGASAIATETVPQGVMVNGFTRGDFWGLFDLPGSTGDTVYARALDGSLVAAAAGNPVANTGGTATFNGTTTMDVTVDGAGEDFAIGQVVEGTGVPVGTYIVSFGTGTGATGTYILSAAVPAAVGVTINSIGTVETRWKLKTDVPPGAVVTGAIALDTGRLTVSGVTSGTLEVGQFITGTGLTAASNARILSQISGTPGGTGVYQTNYTNRAAVSSTTITATQGRLAKISQW